MMTDKELQEFLRRLGTLDKGQLSRLRGIHQNRESVAWKELALLGSLEDPLATVVAGLFALNPKVADGNLGSLCRILRTSDSFDLRFTRLLSIRKARDIVPLLLPLVLMAKSRGIGIPYFTLYRDLAQFDEANRNETFTRWATSYAI